VSLDIFVCDTCLIHDLLLSSVYLPTRSLTTHTLIHVASIVTWTASKTIGWWRWSGWSRPWTKMVRTRPGVSYTT